MQTTILALVVSFVVTCIMGRILIPILRRMKAGQSIREDGPTWHMSKQGTPTMGGLMFIIGIVAAALIVGSVCIINGQYAHLAVLGLALVFGVIGSVDDYVKVKKKQNLGLTAPQKFLLQLAAAVAFLALMRVLGQLTPDLYIPFANVTFVLPWPVYLVFATLVIVGAVNAVNITDGVDGLATGVSMPVALFFMAVAALWGYQELGVFAGALLGGLAGFLIFNFHPAKVFMGDTGSLFLGGAIAGLAFAFNMPLVLIPVGIIYIVETASDIIQVGYFKVTHGKRFFRMAPLHHHLELGGWSEVKLFGVFTAITAVLCVASYFGVASRYLG